MLSFSGIPRAAAAPRQPSPAVGTRHGERGWSRPDRYSEGKKPGCRQRWATSREAPRAWLAGGCTPPPSAIPATRLHSRSNAAVRCKCRRRALHRPTQRAALPIAPRCVFRPIAEQDSVDPLSGEKAVQSVSIQKPQRNSKESPFHPNPKPTAAMATSPNKTADCDATTEASQSVIHSGALSSPRQPNSQFKRQCSLLRISEKPSPCLPNSQFKIQHS